NEVNAPLLVPAALLNGSYSPSPKARAGCVVLIAGKNGVLRLNPDGGLRDELRAHSARVMKTAVVLMIEEARSETRVNRRLVRIGQRTVNLVQSETGKKLRLIGDAMVDPERELIGHRRDGRGRRVGAVPKRPL